MTVDNETYKDITACRTFVYSALVEEMENRRNCPGLEWVDNERNAVANAATRWAQSNGYEGAIVTGADVEHIEHAAVGHVDYAAKLSLYVAEFVVLGGGVSW